MNRYPSLIEILGGANRRTLLWLAITCAGVIVAEYFQVKIWISLPIGLASVLLLEWLNG